MAEKDVFDVIIVGGGPIGLACGIEAKKAGLQYKIIEKGCLVNSLYNYPVNMTFFSTSERLEIGNVPFISHNDKPTRSEALEYYRRVQSTWKLNLGLYEKVERIEKEGGGDEAFYQIDTNKKVYKAANVVLATGFFDFPNLMDVPGESLPKVKHYYDDPHLYARQRVLVVGAANSAVDVALETYRKGAEVTMVVREPEISERVKYWVKPDIDNRIKEGSITAHFNSEVIEIREQEVDILTPDGKITLKNDFVLAMTGYKPDFSFLNQLGVQLSADEEQKPKYEDTTHESNQQGLYLAGVVCGGMKTSTWFIENSRDHAPLIIRDILKKQEIVNS